MYGPELPFYRTWRAPGLWTMPRSRTAVGAAGTRLACDLDAGSPAVGALPVGIQAGLHWLLACVAGPGGDL